MQAYLTLVRREFGSFFSSFTGYLILAIVFLLLGFSFLDILSKLNAEPIDAPITEVFYVTFYFWLILLLTTPVMTMRSFALEKFSGTFETLMTAPVRDWEVVLAKFTGALLFYLLTWLPLAGYSLALQYYSGNQQAALNGWTLLSTGLGIFLIGCLYISLGCLASAFTKSQLVAAMLSYAFGLTLFILSLRSLLLAPEEGWLAKVFSYISMTEHMQDFAGGVVDTRHLFYYLSLTVLFLFLTRSVLESRRWK